MVLPLYVIPQAFRTVAWGCPTGDGVGEEVGDAVGAAVGDAVGGAGVGAAVGHKPHVALQLSKASPPKPRRRELGATAQKVLLLYAP